MKDFEAQESADIEHVRSHFKRISGLYGFSFMDPSPIESLATLETRSGHAIRDEIYYFKDKGDREVALRFDFTMGLTRYAASRKSMRLPAKIAAFGGVFRYDEPQKGRYRYFHQWDIEVYGKPNLESEAETIETDIEAVRLAAAQGHHHRHQPPEPGRVVRQPCVRFEGSRTRCRHSQGGRQDLKKAEG